MTDKIIIDDVYKLPCFYSAITDMYMIHASGSGGIALKWVRDTLCEKELQAESLQHINAYAAMDKLAESIPAGSEGLIVLPHFQGSGEPDVNQYAKGAIYGASLSHTRAHIIRAFMEGIAVCVYRMVESVQELMNFDIKEVIALSGGANSALWCQIKADVLGKPVITMEGTQDAACLGAAILAGYGIGIFESVPEAAEKITKRIQTYTPNRDHRDIYDATITKYKLLTNALFPIAEELQ
ncbi:MAG: hypothetical protein LBN36_01175 [Clostridiales Family XIII bacterium]|jgi:xylulokinase|nr:hypothetical protein [Clostridiales Family XIII bacterium]